MPRCGLHPRHPRDMIMCRPHWAMAPAAVRGAVWDAWHGGRGAGTPEHTAAARAAVRAVSAQLAAGGATP